MSSIPQNTQNVFDGWSEYQFKFLFSSWNTTKVWQFVLTCIAVFFASFSCQLLKWGREKLKKELYKNNTDRLYEKEDTIRLVKTNNSANSDSCLLLPFFMISFFYYTLSLLVLLGTTSFNPWVFLMTVLGYAIGEITFFKRVMILKIERKY